MGKGLRICGIDPGLRHTGWGVVDIDGSHLRWVADGTISPPPRLSDMERLVMIGDELQAVLSRYVPDQAMVEEIFIARNAASALKLGMARGVAMLTLGHAGVRAGAISARRVKQNITGTGRADKTQVTAMVSRLLGIEPQSVDSADALAIAIAASHDQNVAMLADEEGTPATAHGMPQRGRLQQGGLQAAIAHALAKEDAP